VLIHWHYLPSLEKGRLFSNLWAPVPVIEMILLNVRGGGYIDNLPAMLLEVDRISGKWLLLSPWKLPQ